MKYLRNIFPVIIFVGLLAYSIQGCGSKDDSSNINKETNSVKTTPQSNNTVQNNVKTTSPVTNTSNAKKPEHINTKTFKEKVFNYEVNKNWKYEGKLPCIVDFYADWCKPCKMVAPILEELASDYDGKLIIYKVNTDEEQELAQAFGIQSIPTLLFIPKSGDPQMTSGAIPKEEFVRIINQNLVKN